MNIDTITNDVEFAQQLAQTILEWIRNNKRITVFSAISLAMTIKAEYDAWRKGK